MWEPPYLLDEGAPTLQPTPRAFTRELVAEGRRGDAAEYFMTQVVRTATRIRRERAKPALVGGPRSSSAHARL